MSDQTTGPPPPDPSDPDRETGTAVPAQEGAQPQSPDEIDEAREGGGYGEEQADEEEDED